MSQSTEADATHPKTIFHLQRKKTLRKHIKSWCGTSLKFKFPACKYSFNNPVRMNLFL